MKGSFWPTPAIRHNSSRGAAPDQFAANNDANSNEIRLSQLRVAQEKLADLEKIGVAYPFMELTRLEDFKHSLAEIKSEIMQSK